MTTVFGFLFLIFLCFATLQITGLIRSIKQKRFYASLYKAEVTKSYFAIARNELMQMAMVGKISANSNYFKSIYRLNTTIMRTPDQYEKISLEISRILLGIPAFKSSPNSDLTEPEKHILRLTADALGHIVIEYTFPFKFLYRLMRGTEKDLSKGRFLSHAMRITRDLAKVHAEQEIKKAEKEFYTLADIKPRSMEHYDYLPC